MVTYFISDLHLSALRPETSALFLKFLVTEGRNADALYILGDFFEAWIGDDNHNPHDDHIIDAIAELTHHGVPVYFMHGNRDFLIGDQFIEQSNCILLSDPTVIKLYQNQILLTHGDQLCTLDKKYQRFRQFVRHPSVQRFYLSLPLTLRRKIASTLRQRSIERFNKQKDKTNMYFWDVVLSSVYQLLRKHETYTLIHGHTHKPGIHDFILDETPARRIVLGEWDGSGSVLAYSPDGVELKTFI